MRHSKRLVLRTFNRCLEKVLPEDIYLYVLRVLIPVFDPDRRGSGVKVYKDGGLYVAESASSKFYFNSAFNVGRYLFREKDMQIVNRMREKYQYKDVRVESGDVVVDIGANVGEFTMAAARYASLVIAIEPDPAPYKCLVNNTRHMNNVKTLQAAIGEENGETEIFISSSHNDTSFIEPEKWDRKEKVRIMTLATVFREIGIKKIDFLKIEAEGYEPEIIQSAESHLSYIRKVTVDGGPERNGLTTAEQCSYLLRQHGFSVVNRKFMVYGVSSSIATK